MKIKPQEVPLLKGEQKIYPAYQETLTSDSKQALFSGFRMVGLTSRAAVTLITGLALERKHPLEQHSTPQQTIPSPSHRETETHSDDI